MNNTEQLELQIQELQRQLKEQSLKTQTLLAKADKAMETALHAYKLDAYGFLWTYDADSKLYVKTNMRVMSPELVDKAVKTRHLADGCVTAEKIADDVIDSSKIKDRTIEGRSIKNDVIGTEQIKDRSITGDSMEPGAVPNGKLANDAVSTRNLQDRCVTAEKIGLGVILPEHFTPESFAQTIAPYFADLQHQIDALDIHGIAVSNEFGSDPHISISQKTMTDAINKIWQKFEDITGEILQGVNMVVTPEYFISEDGTDVHITANTVDTNGIFEHIAFYGNGTLIAEASNVDYFEHDLHIDETTVIMCKAKIMGVEYTRQSVITHYNSFWLGAGNVYSDIMDVKHVIPITNGMRGAYDVHVEEGQKIIIIVGESLADGFLRADLNSVEIPFTESTVTVDDKNYKVFVSEPWVAGDYNIDVNG